MICRTKRSQNLKRSMKTGINQHRSKRKLNDLKGTDTESAFENKKIAHYDRYLEKLSGNQSVKLENTDIRSDMLDDSSIQLAVRSTTANIANRLEASTNKRKALRKKWLKYK